MAQDAAAAMRLTAQDLMEFGIIDVVVPEPMGGAHRERDIVIDALEDAVDEALNAFQGMEGAMLKASRRDKYLAMGKTGLA